MHYQPLLVVYFTAVASGLPVFSLPGLGSGTGTGGGFPGLPSGIPGLGGGGTGTGGGIPGLPSGIPGLGGGGTGTGGGFPGLPSGIPGLGGGGTGTGGGFPGLPSGIPGLGGDGAGAGGGTPSIPGIPGLGGDGAGSGSEAPSLPTGLPGLGGGSTESETDPSSGSTGGASSGDASSADKEATPNSAAAAAAPGCKAVTVVFARGTTEPGTLGMIVGPGLNTALGSALNNNAVVTGVDYAASAGGIATEVSAQGGAGTKAMVKAVQDTLSSCPDTQIVLSGYSQGAMLVHHTMNNLDATAAGKVKAAVTFGDPFVGQAVDGLPEGAFKSFCATADPVCAAGAGMSPSTGGTQSASAASHLGYGSDLNAAAAFIKGKVSV